MQLELGFVYLAVWLMLLWLGSVALEATGMERSKAHFQALSAHRVQITGELLLSHSPFWKPTISILAIERSDKAIPSPAADQTLLPDDTLLCYGPVKEIVDITRNN